MKKNLKKILATVMVVTIVLASTPLQGFMEMKWNLPSFDFAEWFSIKAKAADYTQGDFTYTVNNGIAILKKYTGMSNSVSIPSTLGGYTVERIGANAFYNCAVVTNVNIPDTVKYIENGAFEKSGLTSLILPKNLQYMGAKIIAGTKVTSVTVPKTVTQMQENYGGSHGSFYDSNITTVIFEEGITAIPLMALHGCKKLTNVTIPNTVTEIKAEAFIGCGMLTSVSIPDSVIRIGSGAFRNTGITSLKLPKNLQYMGAKILAGTNVTSVTVPKTVTQMQENYGGSHGSFYDSNVTTVVFEDGITTIPSMALHGSKKLTNVTIPDSVTEIKNYAFYACDSLKTISIPGTVQKFGTNVFGNCPDVNICSDYLSGATIYAIENNHLFSPTGVFEDKENYALDREVTEYYADMNAMSANGYITITAKYGMKDVWKNKVSDMSVKLFLPNDCELDESTLKLNGEAIKNYTYNGRKVTIPVTGESGTIKYSVKVNSQNDILSYASVNLKKNGVSTQEIIGVISEEVKALTIDAPSTTSKSQIEISGLAPASSTVTLYVNEVVSTEVIASKTGMWFATVTIEEPKEYTDYEITAECENDGKKIQQSVDVTYCSQEPEMTGFKLYYNEHNVIKNVDLFNSGNVKPKVYFLPGSEFKFELDYENADQIDKLYVTSTRSNTKRYLEAVYDEEKNKFIAEGLFDKNNKNYVPGTISVEYTKKTEPAYVGQDVDWEELASHLPENAHESLTVETNTEFEYSASISLSQLVGEEINNAIKTTISVYDEQLGVPLGEWLGEFTMAEELGLLSYVVPGINDEKYIINLDPRDPGNWFMLVHDVTNNKYIKLAYTGIIENQDISEFQKQVKISDCASQLSTLSTVTGILYNQYQISEDMDALRDEVRSSGYLSAEERVKALKRVDDLEYDQTMFMLITTVLPLIISSPVAIGMSMTVPGIILTGMISAMTLVAPLFWEMRTAQIKGEKFNIGWVIDPSGYVYDVHSKERIEGVKTTAYCIESDGTDAFWDNKPSDDSYGTQWVASEYNQLNPLYTNADGKYAWDVPEGWWRVKYEKEGYITTWSEWLPVPPPQTEVNIGMLTVKNSHSYVVSKEVSPTCTKGGTKTYTCVCGDSYEEKIDKLGHSYSSEYTIVKQATCIAKGSKARYCVRKGCTSKTDEVAIAKKSHSYKTTLTKATVSKNGKVVKKCSVCGDIYSTSTIYYPKTIKLSVTSYTYDGKTKTPVLTVKDSAGKVLKKNTAYTVTYPKSSVKAGTYKVVVKFKGDYSGSKTLTYKINPKSASKATVKLSATTYTYNGKAKTPTVTVKLSGKTLKKNTDYTVKYSNNKSVGKATVIITFKGNYSGTKTLTFKINTVKTTVKSLTAGKKSLKVAITKKTTQVTGYQIQYATNKSFKSAKLKNVTSYKTTSVTLKGLSAKKTYYVRVRTYKTVKGVKYYSDWSKTKSKKTK